MNQLLGHSITYRIAVGPQQGLKVFTLQTLPACDLGDLFTNTVGKLAEFSLHAGVDTNAHERDKLERLCRKITKTAVVNLRLIRKAVVKIAFASPPEIPLLDVS